MKLAEGLVLVETAGEYIAVPTGASAELLRGVVRLNESGAEVWRGLEAGEDEAGIAARLAAVYEVDADTALRDTRAVVEKLRAAGLVTD